MPEKLLSVKELAEVLGVHPETIYREVKAVNCNLPFKKIGKSYRFALSEVLSETKNITKSKSLYFKTTIEGSAKSPVLWLHFKSKSGKSTMLNLNNIALEKEGITGAAMVDAIGDYLSEFKTDDKE